MSKRRNWLWIIFGVFFLVICVGIGMMVAAAAWVQQNMTLTETTEGGALQEFDNVRSKYSARPAGSRPSRPQRRRRSITCTSCCGTRMKTSSVRFRFRSGCCE
jgi:hypothetical protein